MFTLPTPEAGVPIVDLTEDSHTIDFILRCCYPANVPTLTEVTEIKHVLSASRKYEIQPVIDSAKAALEGCIEQDPLGVFAVACQMEFPDICRKAAKQTLQHALADLDSPELPLASTVQFHTLDMHF
ncbi:hypothetical protein EWM64_g9113 [Hericium alpestre]|uniref:BTB domain-containing protein n=1 Tax=Hericium alpestre TaxID=135208 RepID=A0A4Y9ZNA0_9AGAM|nr:hypothetical protein EWM64_g9113 [Hericium alpestre]